MTRKQTRTTIILVGLAVLGLAAYLIGKSLNDTITFFYTPSDISEKSVSAGTRIRLGGMVEVGSWKKPSSGNTSHSFVITDTLMSTNVVFHGILPDLFREGQGVVTEGQLMSNGTFKADTVLAKHDENYMPKEVADRLSARGVIVKGMK